MEVVVNELVSHAVPLNMNIVAGYHRWEEVKRSYSPNIAFNKGFRVRPSAVYMIYNHRG